MTARFLTALICTGLAACGGGGGGGGGGSSKTKASASPPPGEPQPPAAKLFADATAASNIAYVVAMTSPPILPHEILRSNVLRLTFGGAAAGDCDGDGDIDLFITYGDGSVRPNHLYLNQWSEGNPLQFAEDAAGAGVDFSRSDGAGNDRHSGPTFADMDGDGDLDLFMGGLFDDPNKVYENRGDCRFDDVSGESGLEYLDSDHTISAAFGDFNLDGTLDLFLTHWGSYDEFADGGQSEHLFQNISDDTGIRFTNISGPTGVTASLIAARQYSTDLKAGVDYTFTPTFARIDDDLWPDIALAADFGTTQLLLADLDSHGWFYDASTDAVRSVQFGMGSALGDYDSDGDLDWFVTSIYSTGEWTDGIRAEGNRLLNNSGFASWSGFINSGLERGVADGGFGWGACFLDVDNDGDLDIYHTNGWLEEFADQRYDSDRSRMFVRGDTGGFVDRAAELGLNDTYNGRGVVCADFDNDGDIDILELTDKIGNSAALWENSKAAAGNNFLRVQLIGLPPNTEAAGARMFATSGGRTQMREIMIGSNYTSQNPTVQIFGLGTATQVDTLRVEWPGLLPGPMQATEWQKSNVPAGVAGETLIICHPELDPAPSGCSLPD